ncbi:MAG: hypothetical protein AAGA87_09850 [Pseudomonadota bacterium]
MKKLIATTMIAGALALNPMASAPAQAGDAKDVLGVIVGLAALAAIANEIDNNRDNRARSRVVIRNNNHTRHRSRVLPSQCLRTLETDRGFRNVLRARCLERNGVRTARLPDRCERTVQTRRGFGTAFAARCLQRQGFAIR